MSSAIICKALGAWCHFCFAEFEHPMDWTLLPSLKDKPAMGNL